MRVSDVFCLDPPLHFSLVRALRGTHSLEQTKKSAAAAGSGNKAAARTFKGFRKETVF